MTNTNELDDEGPNRLKTDTLATSVVLLLVMTVVQRSVGFGRGILFCRWLTPESLGEWEMAYSFILFAAPLVVLGVPGSFGRYLEQYRQRGQLRTFLRRTATWTLCWSSLGVAVVALFSTSISRMLFGADDRGLLVCGIGLCLAGVIMHHTLSSLLSAMRLIRVLSVVNFAQSLLFAVLALCLLFTNSSVGSIVFGYGAACVLASLGGILWIWPGLKQLEAPTEQVPSATFWPKLLRFAFFVWVVNLLTHLFAIVDRYMIVHFSGLGPSEALDQVGHYHSSRIVPLLLVAVADLLAGLIMPHLSKDWEAGQRQRVAENTRLSIKLVGLAMTGMGIGVLLFSPLLFDTILAGKYSDGLSVLPWTLSGCVWFAIYLVSQNYLWCAEKTRLATFPLAIGLLSNIGLNLVLLPMWGLLGAVVATAAATCICLLVILLLSQQVGMNLDFGTWIVFLAPISLTGPLPLAIGVWHLLAIACLASNLVLSATEKKQVFAACNDLLEKVKPFLRRNPGKAVQV